jgi:hypothetical protein
MCSLNVGAAAVGSPAAVHGSARMQVTAVMGAIAPAIAVV